MNEKLTKYTQIVWQELRPQTFMLFALYVCIGFATTWLGQPESNFFVKTQLTDSGWALLVALLMLASWYIMAVTINDIADFDVDAVNLPQAKDRPLQNGSASKHQLRVVAGCSALGVLIGGLILGIPVAAFGVFVVVLAWVYSMPPIRISYRGILAPLLLPIGYIIFPMMIAPLHGGVGLSTGYMLLVAGLYLVFTSRVMLKDYRDVKGDAKYGKRTFLLRAGHGATTVTSATLALIGTVVVAVAIYLLTSRIEAAIEIALLGVLTIPYYQKVYATRSWPHIKVVLPRLGRLLSLQAIVLFSAVLYASQSVPLVAYIALLLLVVYGGYMVMSRGESSAKN